MAGTLFWPFLLQLLAVVVVIAEFILPSMGILTATAIGLFGFSLYLVFTKVSAVAGFIFVAVDICLIPVLVIVGMKLLAASPVTLRTTLDSKEGTQSQPPEWVQLMGCVGSTVTDLHPSGVARINGRRYDVISRGDYITKDSSITVISIDGNRIVVKLTDMV